MANRAKRSAKAATKSPACLEALTLTRHKCMVANTMPLPKPFAFVLMPFSDAFNDTYILGIKPACEQAGYYCERLDEQTFEETMLNRIYNQIAKADVIIADLSEKNANVFYEVGYAHGLNKRAILLTKSASDIPFDLKHHAHIVYSAGIADLKNRLTKRLAYHAEHPESSATDPFNQIALLINGKLVNWASPFVEVTASIVYPDPNSYEAPWLSIDLAFHLLDSALVSKLDLDVRLISTQAFPKSGRRLSLNTTQEYTVIGMPDGGLMHKPLYGISLSVGDPDKAVFDLHPKFSDKMAKEHLVMLRLISSGLQRDIPIKLTVTNYDEAEMAGFQR